MRTIRSCAVSNIIKQSNHPITILIQLDAQVDPHVETRASSAEIRSTAKEARMALKRTSCFARRRANQQLMYKRVRHKSVLSLCVQCCAEVELTLDWLAPSFFRVFFVRLERWCQVSGALPGPEIVGRLEWYHSRNQALPFSARAWHPDRNLFMRLFATTERTPQLRHVVT